MVNDDPDVTWEPSVLHDDNVSGFWGLNSVTIDQRSET